MEKRVVITGLGAITPIGNNVEETWNGIENKKCGIDKITLIDASTYKTKLAAEVKNFNPLEHFEPKQAKRLDRSSQFAMVAAREAFLDSKITKENTDLEKVGVFVSSGIGGLTTIQNQCEINIQKGHNRVSPMFIPMSIANMPAGNIAIEEYKEMLFWTKEEYLKFADVMMDKPVSYYAFEMLYWCGIREGELLALTPADFDFTTHTLRINKSYQRLNREDVITPPKTFKSNRFIKMPQFICDEMQDYMEMLYGLTEDERIFTISKSYLHHEMNRGSKVSGVKRIRVHDLRHSHVSLLINMGFTVLAIADRMGHESIDITYRYAHLFPSEQTQMAEQLDIERMEKLNGEKSGQ